MAGAQGCLRAGAGLGYAEGRAWGLQAARSNWGRWWKGSMGAVGPGVKQSLLLLMPRAQEDMSVFGAFAACPARSSTYQRQPTRLKARARSATQRRPASPRRACS